MSGIESAAAATAAFSMGIDAGKSQTKVVLQEQGQHLSVAALVSHVIHVKPDYPDRVCNANGGGRIKHRPQSVHAGQPPEAKDNDEESSSSDSDFSQHESSSDESSSDEE